MSDALDLLWPPFLVALCLIGIHAWFGIEVLRRKVIFVDLALAQIAALGTTVAFMLGHSMQGPAAWLYSLAFTLVAALLLSFVPQWSRRLPQEALIGVIYVVAAAAAILLIDRAPQGAEHLKQILTGNILTAGTDTLVTIVPLYAAIGALHAALRRRIAAADGAWGWEFVFYASFGVVVTSSVALAGVLLVFAFLIIPAAIGALHANRFREQLAIAWIAGAATAIAGLAISYAGDFSTGATLVCTYGLALALAGIAHTLRAPQPYGATFEIALRFARWFAAALLAASAIWIAIAPRADQPVLDALEGVFPAVRNAYMNETLVEIAAEAERDGARYRDEADKLRARESERRWKGEPLEEIEVRKIASFLKSYNEMVRGSEFVVREVRSRAREANRGWIAAVFLAFAAALLISVRASPPRRSRTQAP
jgi:zinc/manganese transport system permease protein